MGRTRTFDLDQALDAPSIQRLCQAMGTQPGSGYAAFGSKRNLFVATLRRYIETASTEAARIDGAESGLQGLRDYFAHFVDAMVDGKRCWGCLVTKTRERHGWNSYEFLTGPRTGYRVSLWGFRLAACEC